MRHRNRAPSARSTRASKLSLVPLRRAARGMGPWRRGGGRLVLLTPLPPLYSTYTCTYKYNTYVQCTYTCGTYVPEIASGTRVPWYVRTYQGTKWYGTMVPWYSSTNITLSQKQLEIRCNSTRVRTMVHVYVPWYSRVLEYHGQWYGHTS